MHEHDVRRADGDIGAGADGDADVGAREGRRVVDAVAHHGHLVVARLEFADLLLLLLRQHARDDLVYAHLACDGHGGAALVAREQDGLHAHLVQPGHGLRAGLFDGVGHRDHAERLSVGCEEERGLALVGKPVGHLGKLREVDLLLPQQATVASEHEMPVDRGCKAAALDLLELVHDDVRVGRRAALGIHPGHHGIG